MMNSSLTLGPLFGRAIVSTACNKFRVHRCWSYSELSFLQYDHMVIFCCFSVLPNVWVLFTITEKTPEAKEGTKGHKLWRCPICTYDNEDSFTACDICGVLRIPLVNDRNNRDDGTGT